MITHYGVNWKERDVFWGLGKKKGEMLGRTRERAGRPGRPSAKRAKNFNCYRQYVGLYCLYDGSDLIYIGEAGLKGKRSIFDRLKGHRKGPIADRWDRFSWFGCRTEHLQKKSSNRSALAILEAVSIAIINPGFNKQSGTFCDAKQVFQVSHDDSVGDIETKIDRMWDDLCNIWKDIEEIKDKPKK